MSLYLEIAQTILLAASMIGLWVCIWLLHKEQERVADDVATICNLLVEPVDTSPVDTSRGTLPIDTYADEVRHEAARHRMHSDME